MNAKHLSDRELDVMQILWRSEKPLLASEILKEQPDLNINTIQATLRKLLSRNFVRIADIVQSGKVLGRTYAANISSEKYILSEFHTIFPESSKYKSAFFAAFIEESDDKENALQELEDMIKEYRKGLVE